MGVQLIYIAISY